MTLTHAIADRTEEKTALKIYHAALRRILLGVNLFVCLSEIFAERFNHPPGPI